jgi:hypothetical protein
MVLEPPPLPPVGERPKATPCVIWQNNSTVSRVVHQLTANGIGTMCKPRGVRGRIEVLTDGGVTCSKCLHCAEVAIRRADERRAIESRRAEAEQIRQSRRAEAAGYPRQADEGVNERPVYVPWASDPVPIPKAPPDCTLVPQPGADSVTIGELVSLLIAGPVDSTKPIRALGDFSSHSTIGVMLSEDGSLVIMSVD